MAVRTFAGIVRDIASVEASPLPSHVKSVAIARLHREAEELSRQVDLPLAAPGAAAPAGADTLPAPAPKGKG